MTIRCKQCGAQAGSQVWPDHTHRFEYQERSVRPMGNGYDAADLDAGVFCSTGCLGKYLESAKPVSL